MMQWTKEQKEQIWKMYAMQQKSIAQIAQQYAAFGATRLNVALLIGHINQKRDAEVDEELRRAARNKARANTGKPRGGYLKEKRSDNKMTEEEISNIRAIRP